MTARLARKNTRIGGVEIPVGTKVFLALAAANRDPRRWSEPTEFQLNRDKIKEHVALRPRCACLCRCSRSLDVEVRVILERFLEQNVEDRSVRHSMERVAIGHLDFEPSFIIRGLAALHLTLTGK